MAGGGPRENWTLDAARAASRECHQEELEEFIWLHRAGLQDTRALAWRLGVSERTVQRWRRQARELGLLD